MLWVSPIYTLTLLWGAHLGPNAKFLQTLIWLTVVNRQNVSCPTGFQRFFLDVNSRTVSGGGTSLTTVDHSDIRGLVTARLGFVAELLSLTNGSSTCGLIQQGHRGFS